MKRRGFLKTLAVLPLAMKIALTEPVFSEPLPVFSAPLTYEKMDAIYAWLVDESQKVWVEWNREMYLKVLDDG